MQNTAYTHETDIRTCARTQAHAHARQREHHDREQHHRPLERHVAAAVPRVELETRLALELVRRAQDAQIDAHDDPFIARAHLRAWPASRGAAAAGHARRGDAKRQRSCLALLLASLAALLSRRDRRRRRART